MADDLKKLIEKLFEKPGEADGFLRFLIHFTAMRLIRDLRFRFQTLDSFESGDRIQNVSNATFNSKTKSLAF